MQKHFQLWGLISVSLLSVSIYANAHAATLNGFYAGGQVGNSMSSYNDTILGINSANDLDKNGLAGRIYFGYQYSKNWATEVGYARFHSLEVTNINRTGNDGMLKESAIDIAGKAILPFSHGIGVYAKLGAAYLTANPENGLNDYSTTFDNKKSNWRLEYGIGATLQSTRNLSLDLSATRIQKSNDVPNLNFLAIGVEYHFG